MKATLFAMVFCVVSYPLFAATQHSVASSVSNIQKINLNSADVNTLMHSIKGIGAKRAEAIVQYRKTHGVFKSINDLSLVRGFGKTFIKSHAKQVEERFVV